MKKFIGLILMILTGYCNTCFAKIIQTNDIKVIEETLASIAPDTLVIFDVDDVLIAPTEEFTMIDPIRKKLSKELKLKYDREKHQILFSDFFNKRTIRLVNPKIIGLLNDLKTRHIPTTALTGWWTGKFGKISAMEELRFKGLNEVNISFVDMSPLKKKRQFPDLKTKGGVPIVKNGIILTALADKGEVLLAVLDKEKLPFKQIIFIDDDLVQIESVKKACQKMGVNYIGVHYTAVKLIPLPKLNEEMEKLRFEILEKEGLWLSDKELKMHKMQEG